MPTVDIVSSLVNSGKELMKRLSFLSHIMFSVLFNKHRAKSIAGITQEWQMEDTGSRQFKFGLTLEINYSRRKTLFFDIALTQF